MDEKRDYRVPMAHCLNCGHEIDGAYNPPVPGQEKSHRPEPGSITMCLYCGELMAFTDQLLLRELTPSEHVEVVRDHRPLVMVAAAARSDWLKQKGRAPT